MSLARNRRRMMARETAKPEIAALSRYSTNVHLLLLRASAMYVARCATSCIIQLGHDTKWQIAQAVFCKEAVECAVCVRYSEPEDQPPIIVDADPEKYKAALEWAHVAAVLTFSPDPQGRIVFRHRYVINDASADDEKAFKRTVVESMRVVMGIES